MQVNSIGAAYASAPQYESRPINAQGAVPMFQNLVLNSGDDVAFSVPSSGGDTQPLAYPFGTFSRFV